MYSLFRFQIIYFKTHAIKVTKKKIANTNKYSKENVYTTADIFTRTVYLIVQSYNEYSLLLFYRRHYERSAI